MEKLSEFIDLSVEHLSQREGSKPHSTLEALRDTIIFLENQYGFESLQDNTSISN